MKFEALKISLLIIDMMLLSANITLELLKRYGK
jgi:hypothetical protein